MKNTILTQRQKSLRKRIVEVSFNNRLSHIGSCLNSIDLIDGVYSLRSTEADFVLSSGHAAVAWLVVLESLGLIAPIKEINCIHPDTKLHQHALVSTGSLGQGLPISIGFALANPRRTIYCLVSDGECSEGSIWESLRIIVDNSIRNLVVMVSANGYGAYDPIAYTTLKMRLKGYCGELKIIDGHDPKQIRSVLTAKSSGKPIFILAKTRSDQLPFLHGLGAHYYVMGKDYQDAIDLFS